MDKYKAAEELGFLDKIRKTGWNSLTAKESGEIGKLIKKCMRRQGNKVKVSLNLDGGAIRVNANITQCQAAELFKQFCAYALPGKTIVPEAETAKECSRLSAMQAVAPLEPALGEAISEISTEKNTVDEMRPEFFVYITTYCEECERTFVGRLENDNGVQCRCGNTVHVESIGLVDGTCPNCEAGFRHYKVANGHKEIICKHCKSRVDLVELADGTYTGVHDLKY